VREAAGLVAGLAESDLRRGGQFHVEAAGSPEGG
jgi:hypothetical protein